MNNSHDPLTVLTGADHPVSPDPGFAARLRARLESALTLPTHSEGVDMSGTGPTPAPRSPGTSTPSGRYRSASPS